MVAIPGEAALPRQLDLAELVVAIAVAQGNAFGAGAGLKLTVGAVAAGLGLLERAEVGGGLGVAVSGIVLVGDAVGVAGGVVVVILGLDDLDEVVMTVIGEVDDFFRVIGALGGGILVAALTGWAVGEIVLVVGDLAFAVDLFDEVAVFVVLVGGFGVIGPDFLGFLVVFVRCFLQSK